MIKMKMNRKISGSVLLLFLLNIILISEVTAAEDCTDKRIGVVGASNEVLGPRDDLSEILAEKCAGAKVFLQAQGSSNPKTQGPLVKAVLANDNLDYVILDPSANGQLPFTVEEYETAALNLAQLVKSKNNNIKVIMLANTPLKNSGYWNANPTKVQNNIDTFNADLLNKKLGRPDLIDYAVDAYSATEDPAGSDECGKYCRYLPDPKSNTGYDNIHFGSEGERQVAEAILNTVFRTAPGSSSTASPSSTTSPSSSSSSTSSSTSVPVLVPIGAGTPLSTGTSTATSTNSPCQSDQRCQEIDKVWLQIAAWVNNLRKGQIWDTMRGWVSYQEKLPSISFGPSTTGLTVKQSFKNIAEAEWERWERGTKMHADASMRSILDSYYSAAAGSACPPGSNPNSVPWSASFISYVAKQAGVTSFPVNCAHSGYFNSIRNNPGACKTYPMSERSKINVGDVVCHCRLTAEEIAAGKTSCSNDYNNPSTYGHCDVVVSVLGSNQLEVIGGNVANTVSKRIVDVSTDVVVSPNSVVNGERKWYGFISCAGVTAAPVVASEEICVATTGTPEERALLDTIGWAEATGNRYDMVAFGQFVAEKDPSNPYRKEGNLNLFSNYNSHPNILIRFQAGECTGGADSSCTTAAGRYQFLYTTYNKNKNQNCDIGCFKTGFNPKEQDQAALKVARDSGVTNEMLKYAEAEGNFISIWDKLAPTWASLPSSAHGGKSAFGQGSKSTTSLQEKYLACLQVERARMGVASSASSSSASSSSSPSSTSSSQAPSAAKPLGSGVKTVQDLSPACTIPTENKGKSESAGVEGCPAGMVKVATFCVDRFEGTLVDKNTNEPYSPYCSPGKGNAITNLKAVSLAGVVPQGYISGDQAAMACQNAGKHLCTQSEWLTACQGNAGNKFPYGNTEVPGQCNYGRAHPDVKTAEVPNAKYDLTDPQVNKNYALSITGNFGQCANPQGAFDMTGNLQEWVNDGSGASPNKFGGGYYGATLQQVIQSPTAAVGCGFQNVGHPSNHWDYSLGFRCCANPTS